MSGQGPSQGEGARSALRPGEWVRPQDLIHTNNSPKQAMARVFGRLVFEEERPKTVALGEVLDLLNGVVSPVQFRKNRRRAYAKSTRTD